MDGAGAPLEPAGACVEPGDVGAAMRELESALASTPVSAAVCRAVIERLDALIQAQPDRHAARREWTRLAARFSGQPMVWFKLARAHAMLGELDEAVAGLERAAALGPEDAGVWRALGGIHAESWRFEPARACLQRALDLQPDDECASLLGWVKNEMGDVAGALAVLAPPAGPAPVSFGRRLRHALLLPQIYTDGGDPGRWRMRYGDGLAAMHAELERYCPDAGQVFNLNQSNFLLAYQGGDDLSLQREYARLLGRLIARARPDLIKPAPRRRDGGRIKVAFLSSFLRECTIGHYFRSWIEGLDPARFETTVIYTGAQPDATTVAIGGRADHFLVKPGHALEVAEAVLAVGPDILIYPEVGMHSKNYLLANLRLAPIQCAAWGHPVTTGSARIDYFLTCEAMEPADADRHYSETLLRLPGLGTGYPRPATDLGVVTREQLGLPADRHLYLCPQSLFKVHPDNDALYLDILAADPRALLLFFQESAAPLTMAFANRLAAGMARRGMPPRNQIKFLPRLDPAGFRAVLGLADVVLDTLHWSGGNTSLDALSVGAPIVTLPGAFMRGRQSQAMLNMLGVPELIAADTRDYVEIALRVAAEPDLKATLRRRMLTNSGELFGRAEPLLSLASHLERIHRAGDR